MIEEEHIVLEHVLRRRADLPREGVRKLSRAISQDLADSNIKFGRDKLFDLLRKNKMLVRPKKNYVRTTNSWHRFHKHPNLIKTPCH